MKSFLSEMTPRQIFGNDGDHKSECFVPVLVWGLKTRILRQIRDGSDKEPNVGKLILKRFEKLDAIGNLWDWHQCLIDRCKDKTKGGFFI